MKDIINILTNIEINTEFIILLFCLLLFPSDTLGIILLGNDYIFLGWLLIIIQIFLIILNIIGFIIKIII